jgi:hypothetical protein
MQDILDRLRSASEDLYDRRCYWESDVCDDAVIEIRVLRYALDRLTGLAGATAGAGICPHGYGDHDQCVDCRH